MRFFHYLDYNIAQFEDGINPVRSLTRSRRSYTRYLPFRRRNSSHCSNGIAATTIAPLCHSEERSDVGIP